MAMRTVAKRLGARRPGAIIHRAVQTRPYSDGKVLNDEERAQENIYIKKMEKEKLEKAKQAAKAETPHGAESTSESASSPVPGPTTDSSKNLAFFAGVAGILAVGVWYARSGSKKEEVKK